MADPVPAVAEAAATGETAAIFADIRAVYRVGVVNLIWRHLATIDGALPWAWGALRPLYVDGTVAREAALLHAGLALPAAPVVPAPVFQALGLSDDDVAAIRAVLAAYDRTNAMALIALTALQANLAGATGAPPPPSVTTAAATDIPLPRLLTLDEMAPATAELVLALNRFGSRRDDPILASMYRHLAHWPACLGLGWALLAPLDADGRLGHAIDAATAQAAARAARLPLATAPLCAAARPLVAAALEPFAADVIARMVVICALLRRTIGGRERPAA